MGAKVVTYLGSLIQWCCGDGGALQTNIPGVCSQCPGRTGFAPAHSVCAFPVYTAQAPVCSACNYLRWALGCVYFPGLRGSGSGSGSQVLHKGADSVRPAFCALPRTEQLRRRGTWQAQSAAGVVCLISSLIPAAQIPGWQQACPSQVGHVSLLGSWSLAVTLPADVNRPESQEVLVSKWEPACSFVEDASLRLRLPLFGSGCPRLPPCLQRGMSQLTAS